VVERVAAFFKVQRSLTEGEAKVELGLAQFRARLSRSVSLATRHNPAFAPTLSFITKTITSIK
jgi:hypothetical protein